MWKSGNRCNTSEEAVGRLVNTILHETLKGKPCSATPLKNVETLQPLMPSTVQLPVRLGAQGAQTSHVVQLMLPCGLTCASWWTVEVTRG